MCHLDPLDCTGMDTSRSARLAFEPSTRVSAPASRRPHTGSYRCRQGLIVRSTLLAAMAVLLFGAGFPARAQVTAPPPLVNSVAGKTGTVTVSAGDVVGLGSAAVLNVGTTPGTVAAGDDSRIAGALSAATAASTYAPLASPALAGTPTAPTPAATDNSTKLATTAYVRAQGYLTACPTASSGTAGCVQPDGTTITNAAGVISVGTVPATAVSGLTAAAAAAAPVQSVAGRTGAVTLSLGDISGAGTLAGLGAGSGLSSGSGSLAVVYGTAAGTAAQGNDSRITGAAQTANNLSDLASAGTARTNLGLGTSATLASTAVAQTANNLSDLASAATARSNLGLGTAATLASSAVAQTTNNLSDLANAGTARGNLGLGSIATQSAGAVAISGGTIGGADVSAADVTSSGSSTASTLAARHAHAPNAIDDFGATGNGSTDDTAALQKAFTASATQAVTLPCGTYRVSSPLTVPTNGVIRGETNYAWYYSSQAGSPCALIKVIISSNWTGANGVVNLNAWSRVEGIGIDATPYTNISAFYTTSSYIELDRVFTYGGMHGVAAVFTTGAALQDLRIFDSTISGSFSDCVYAYYYGGVQVLRNDINGCGAGNHGAAVNLYQSAFGMIDDNQLQDNYIGLEIVGYVRDTEVVSNHFDTNTYEGILFSSSTGPNSFVGNSFSQSGVADIVWDNTTHTGCQTFTGNIYQTEGGSQTPYIFQVAAGGSLACGAFSEQWPAQGSGVFAPTPSAAISSIAWAGGVATVTTAAAHGLGSGGVRQVTISGASPSGYNGTYWCTMTGTTTFTCPLTGNPGTETTPGTYVAQFTQAVLQPMLLPTPNNMPGPYANDATAAAAGVPVGAVYEDAAGVSHVLLSVTGTTGGDGGVTSLGGLTGAVICGTNVTCSSGTISASTYTLPAATSSTLGGVKPDGTTIANSGGAISVGTIPGSAIGSGTVSASYLPAVSGLSGSPSATQLSTAIPSAATSAPECGSGAAGAVAACGSGMVLPSGTTATTQSAGTSNTTVATTAFVAGAVPLTAAFVTTSNSSYALPSNWHAISGYMIGGGGGSGCGVVTSSGTAASGGGTGGTATRVEFQIRAADVGSPSTASITIGAAGTSCTASGTTAGSSGSAPGVGGTTSITLGSVTVSAYGGGAGSNGQQSAGSAGGGGAGYCGPGSNASGATAGNGGCAGYITGGSAGVGSHSTVFWMGSGGNGTASGAAGNVNAYGFGPGPGGSGGGLATSPAALAGGAGAQPSPVSPSSTSAGATTCTGTSQNGANGALTLVPPNALTGAGGGGGASCTASAGGNGGAASGYGASGGGGGASLAGYIAGSGGASSPGAVFLMIW